MALQTVDPHIPSAQVVANAFVEQYYQILHYSPELVYRFYQDSSVLSRQDENDKMTSVTTMQGINARILSLDYKNYKAEIKTADAQESYKNGVTVLVTGCLTGKDNIKRKFAQSFFLAPQVKGYFVLNDVFRYVDESEPLNPNVVAVEKVDDTRTVQLAADAETARPSGAPASDLASSNKKNDIQDDESLQTIDKEAQVHTGGTVPLEVTPSTGNHISKSNQTPSQEDNVKNSYASMVRKYKGSPPGPAKIYVPISTVRATPSNTQKQSSASVSSASVAEISVHTNSKTSEGVETHEEAEGYSIYVRNLPMTLTDVELEEEFKRFGPIKHGGVQVRSNRQQGSCYGFVEFLSASSMESAIQASPVTIRGRPAFVDFKRSTTRVNNGRGGVRFSSGRGGFDNDNIRGRGNYGHGGFGRNESVGRGRGRSYQRARGRAGLHS